MRKLLLLATVAVGASTMTAIAVSDYLHRQYSGGYTTVTTRAEPTLCKDGNEYAALMNEVQSSSFSLHDHLTVASSAEESDEHQVVSAYQEPRPSPSDKTGKDCCKEECSKDDCCKEDCCKKKCADEKKATANRSPCGKDKKSACHECLIEELECLTTEPREVLGGIEFEIEVEDSAATDGGTVEHCCHVCNTVGKILCSWTAGIGTGLAAGSKQSESDEVLSQTVVEKAKSRDCKACEIEVAVRSPKNLETRTYHIGDLLAAPDPAREDGESMKPRDIIKMVTAAVEPETWDTKGGPGHIEYCPLETSIVVHHKPEIHEQVKFVLLFNRLGLAEAERVDEESVIQQDANGVLGLTGNCFLSDLDIPVAVSRPEEVLHVTIRECDELAISCTDGETRIETDQMVVTYPGKVKIKLDRRPNRLAPRAESSELETFQCGQCEEDDVHERVVRPAPVPDDAPTRLEPMPELTPAGYQDQKPVRDGKAATPEQLPSCDDPCKDMQLEGHPPYTCPYLKEKYRRQSSLPGHERVCPYTGASDYGHGCYYHGELNQRFRNTVGEVDDPCDDFMLDELGDDDGHHIVPVGFIIESDHVDNVVIEGRLTSDHVDNVVIGLTPEGRVTTDVDVPVEGWAPEEVDPSGDFEYPSDDYPDVGTAEFRPTDYKEYETPFIPF